MAEGRQRFSTSLRWTDDYMNRSVYEATAREIFPVERLVYPGPAVMMSVYGNAFLITSAIYVAGFILQGVRDFRRRRLAREAGES